MATKDRTISPSNKSYVPGSLEAVADSWMKPGEFQRWTNPGRTTNVLFLAREMALASRASTCSPSRQVVRHRDKLFANPMEHKERKIQFMAGTSRHPPRLRRRRHHCGHLCGRRYRPHFLRRRRHRPRLLQTHHRDRRRHRRRLCGRHYRPRLLRRRRPCSVKYPDHGIWLWWRGTGWMRDKTASRAIIRQLVCGRYCYLMLMPLDPIDTCVRDGTKNRFQLRNGEVRHGCVPFSATPANTGVVHEEADSGMLRVLIRCTVRVRSNLSGMYHRAVESRGQEGEPATRDRRRMNEGQGRRGKKSLYRATVAPSRSSSSQLSAEKLQNPPVLLP